MSFSNERGQYGYRPRIGADVVPNTGSSSTVPLMLGALGLAAIGLAILGARAAAANRPRLTAHEKEVRAWEAEFPGLPWFQDEVRSTCQLDLWERARDHWERKR